MTTATKAPAAKKPPVKPPAKKQAPARKKGTVAEAAAVKRVDDNIIKKAQEALSAVGLDFNQVIGELIPTEADEDNVFRLPLRPTIKTVQSAPIAVVMLEWDMDYSDSYSKPLDRDSELFTELDDAKAYYDIQMEFAINDVKNPDLRSRHLVLMFTDTSDLMSFNYDIVVHKTADGVKDWASALKQLLDDKEHEFVFSGRTEAFTNKNAAAKKTASGPKVTRKRAKSAGAPDLDVKDVTPIKSAKVVKTAQSKAEAKEAAAAAKVASLNERLANSRAARANRQEAKDAAAPAANDGDQAEPIAPKGRKRPAAKAPAQSAADQAEGFAGPRPKRTPKKVAQTFVDVDAPVLN